MSFTHSIGSIHADGRKNPTWQRIYFAYGPQIDGYCLISRLVPTIGCAGSSIHFVSIFNTTQTSRNLSGQLHLYVAHFRVRLHAWGIKDDNKASLHCLKSLPTTNQFILIFAIRNVMCVVSETRRQHGLPTRLFIYRRWNYKKYKIQHI